MYLTPFVTIFARQGEQETRVVTTSGYPGLPDDEYALVESYCIDPKCDCRRVMLNVAGRRQAKGYLTSVSFGFDRDEDLAGPLLDPLNPQSQYADTLFPLVVQILADPAYVARLESHYRQIKRAAADPQDPRRQTIHRILSDEKRWEASPDRSVASVRKTATGRRKKRRRR